MTGRGQVRQQERGNGGSYDEVEAEAPQIDEHEERRTGGEEEMILDDDVDVDVGVDGQQESEMFQEQEEHQVQIQQGQDHEEILGESVERTRDEDEEEQRARGQGQEEREEEVVSGSGSASGAAHVDGGSRDVPAAGHEDDDMMNAALLSCESRSLALLCLYFCSFFGFLLVPYILLSFSRARSVAFLFCSRCFVWGYRRISPVVQLQVSALLLLTISSSLLRAHVPPVRPCSLSLFCLFLFSCHL